MSETNMSKGLKEALGIDPGDSVINALGLTPDGNVDNGEFDEYKDQERDPSENVLAIPEVETSVPDLQDSDAKIDYVIARNHTYALLGATTQAVGRALAVAKETEHPRAFESFNSLVATARTLTQDLLALQKAYKEVTKGRPEMETTPIVTVNVSNGTTELKPGLSGPPASAADLMKELQEAIDRGEIKPIQVNRQKPKAEEALSVEEPKTDPTQGADIVGVI
jgi:hypothetical protein